MSFAQSVLFHRLQRAGPFLLRWFLKREQRETRRLKSVVCWVRTFGPTRRAGSSSNCCSKWQRAFLLLLLSQRSVRAAFSPAESPQVLCALARPPSLSSALLTFPTVMDSAKIIPISLKCYVLVMCAANFTTTTTHTHRSKSKTESACTETFCQRFVLPASKLNCFWLNFLNTVHWAVAFVLESERNSQTNAVPRPAF